MYKINYRLFLGFNKNNEYYLINDWFKMHQDTNFWLHCLISFQYSYIVKILILFFIAYLAWKYYIFSFFFFLHDLTLKLECWPCLASTHKSLNSAGFDLTGQVGCFTVHDNQVHWISTV